MQLLNRRAPTGIRDTPLRTQPAIGPLALAPVRRHQSLCFTVTASAPELASGRNLSTLSAQKSETMAGPDTESTEGRQTVQSHAREFVLCIFAFLWDLWMRLVSFISHYTEQLTGTRLRLAPVLATQQASASNSRQAMLTAPTAPAVLFSEGQQDSSASRQDDTAVKRAGVGLPASASEPALWEPRRPAAPATCANLPSRRSAAMYPVDPIVVDAGLGERRNMSFDLADHHHPSLDHNIQQLGSMASEALSRVQHVFHDTPNAAAEVAGHMMGREGYHHPCPTRAMSMPGSPRSATRAAAGVTHGWRNLVSRFTGDGVRRPDVSLHALLDSGFRTALSSPASGMIRDTSAGGAEDSDAAGQASLAVLGGPMASERLAKGLRTAEQTLKHPQATAAEVAGRILGKSSGHDAS